MVTKKQMKSAEAERELAAHEKMTAKSWLILILGIIVAGIVRAVGIQIFVVPNSFAPGGVTGIASMLENKLPGHPNAGYFLLALNVPLIIIAFIFVGKRFAAITGVSLLLSSGLMVLFEKINIPVYTPGGDKILAAIAGGVFGGAGIAILIKLGGSSGGTDVIATMVQKRHSATNVAWFIFAIDSSVVVVSFFVYGRDWTPVLLSFVEMFASSKVVETVLQGFKSALKFEIITKNPDELSQEIIHILHRGVTMVPAKGMYTGEERAMLICVLRKGQLSKFREILRRYPDTFAYISGTSEVVGRGFTS